MYRHTLMVRVRCDTLQMRDMCCIVLAAITALRYCSVSEPLTELMQLTTKVCEVLNTLHLLPTYHDGLSWWTCTYVLNLRLGP